MSDVWEMIDAVNAAEAREVPADLADVDLMIGHDYEMAKDYLVGHKDRQLLPTWSILAGNGQLALVATPFDGESQKEMVAQAMQKMMGEMNAIRYTFASECWMAKVDKDEWEKDKRLPSERDNRIEALVIIGCDRERVSSAMYEIVRDDEGCVVELKRQLGGEGEPQLEGRFVGLLGEEEA